MEAKLVVVGGEIKSGEFALDLPTVVGRGHDAGLRLAHPLVSRRHCEISEKNGLLYVRDLGSLNGTFISDNRITETVLRPDELITIGPVILRAVYAGGKTDDPADPQAKAEAAALISGKKTARLTKTVAPSNDSEIRPPGLSSNRSTADHNRTTIATEERIEPDDISPPPEEPVDDDDDKLNDFFKGMGIK